MISTVAVQVTAEIIPISLIMKQRIKNVGKKQSKKEEIKMMTKAGQQQKWNTNTGVAKWTKMIIKNRD